MSGNTINEQTAAYLRSAAAQAMLAELQPNDLRPERLLTTLTRLRHQVTGEEAGALVTLAKARQRAADKFPDAHQLYFVSEALEQATAWEIAERRAIWMDQHLPPGPVLDLGCGIGGDLLALAQYRRVVAYEYDAVRISFAEANAKTMGVANRVEFRHADWTVELAQEQLPFAVGAFADPTRRRKGRRVFRLHEMEPPLASLLVLRARVPALGIKVMPGVSTDEIPDGCGVEFTGHAGSCKEAVLWFGPLALHRRWASVHVDGRWHEIVAGGAEPPVGRLNVGDVVYEPHPAVIRAGAFAELCRQLDAHLLDRHIAYLVSPDLHEHPLVQAFHVLETHPFSLKQLNRRLQALGIGELELKKRGFPVEPEQLRSRLKLAKRGRPAVLLLARHGDKHLMIIAERIAAGHP